MTPGQSVFSRSPRRPPADPRLRARDEKLESLKAVVGKLAHDFNNFLVPQFGYLTLLKEDLPANSPALGYANTMEAAARKSEGYIESILLGMRPHRQFSPREFSFDALVRESTEKWLAEIAEDAGVRLSMNLEAFNFYGDPKQWRNAIEHLLSNARFALAMGGNLEVRLSARTLPGQEIQRLGLGTADVYELVLSDDGFGMTSEVADRAFDPFFTTRTIVKAAGLGLTIVHGVTQFHGGQVELQTEEHKGTRVTLWIPAGGVNAGDKLAAVGAGRPVLPQRKKRVLLVEDDPLIKEVLRSWLNRFELEVQTVETAEAAAKTLERNPAEWVLAITETDLRSATGEEVYQKLCLVYPNLEWIFLAGKRSPVFGSSAGGNEPLVMKKPFTLKALSEVVRRHAPGQL
jgi:CheY-like chemotaxis protein